MEFSFDLFRKNGIQFPTTFKMPESLDFRSIDRMEQVFSEEGTKIGTALRRLKKRTPDYYYNSILLAQTEAQNYSINSFPLYRLLLPDVLMDDWLSIICPHMKGKRDHSLHQPLTAYIVSELLRGGDDKKGLRLPSGKPLLDACAEMFLDKQGTKYLRDYYEVLYPEMPPKGYIRNTWAKELFYQTSIIAALFHDIGYPWQFLNKVGSCTGIVNREGLLMEDSSGECIYNFIEKRLLAYPFYAYSATPQHSSTASWNLEVVKLIDEAYRKTHGFPGALAFMYLNDSIRKFAGNLSMKQADCRFIQDWAAVGIMMHDMVWRYYGKNMRPDQPRFRLSMDKDPLSCIIAMADVLEEFGRPSADFRADVNNDRGVCVSFNDSPCKKTIINVNASTLEITYQYNTIEDRIKYEKGRKDEIENYFKKPFGFIDLSAIGINKVLCDVKYVPPRNKTN